MFRRPTGSNVPEIRLKWPLARLQADTFAFLNVSDSGAVACG